MTSTAAREFVTDLTYPISPSYVSGWDSTRAAAECIANAIDADPENFTATYADGIFTISDTADRGVGAEGMVMGHSDKRDNNNVIGQFGEGLKIGSLVLAREPEIGKVYVETVGYGFEPLITEHAGIAGLNIPSNSDTAPQVLTWRLFKSDRTRGTVVTIECPESVAVEAMARFRHLQVPGYVAPATPGVVITDGKPGRVYIGGVFVTSQKDLTFSYDLSLEVAKRWQNRDRSVIDSYMLSSAVGQILAECEDVDVLTALVNRVLAGAKGKSLSDIERTFMNVRTDTPAKRRLWADIAERVVGDRKVYFNDHSVGDETLLDLADRGYTELQVPGLDRWHAKRLMDLLNVPAAGSLATKVRAKKTTADYVADKDLTAQERDLLNSSVRMLRAIYGPHALDKVKVYSAVRIENNPDLAWNGFYEPTTGTIAVDRALLSRPTDLDDTLTHEVAHRLAHRYFRSMGLTYADHADRSRGFEHVLGRMAAMAMRALSSGLSVADLEAQHAEQGAAALMPPLPAGMCWAGEGRGAKQVAVTANGAATIAQAAIDAWAIEQGLDVRKVPMALSSQHFISAALVRQIRDGKCGLVEYARIAEVTSALGMTAEAAPVLWWALVGATGPYAYKSVTAKNKRFAARVLVEAQKANAVLEAAGGDYAQQGALLALLADGQSVPAVTADSAEWQGPIVTLLGLLADAQGLSSVDDLPIAACCDE